MTEKHNAPSIGVRSGDSFTVTSQHTVKAQEGDMFTDPTDGMTYVYDKGEWRTITEMARRGNAG